MTNTRQIVDFSINDQGKEARDALYAEIHDRVMAKFEEMKTGIAQNLIAPHMESVEHDDEEEDKKLVKKMVKGKCLKTEGIEDSEDEYDEDEDEDYDEELDEVYENYECGDLEQIDELSVGKLQAYVKKATKANKHYTNASLSAMHPHVDKSVSDKFHKKAINTFNGVQRAEKKLGNKHFPLIQKNEEFDDSLEQIDELSKSTMGSYLQKSIQQKMTGKKDRLPGMQKAYKKMTTKPTTEQFDLNENYGDMSHAAKELVLHADNDHHLYHSSHTPIMNNLKKKMKAGTYHPEKAKKLWAYHADRAAQSYAKHHGDGTPWHKMFSTSDRKAAASHWEDMHRHELND